MDTLKKVFAKKLLDIKAIKLQPNDLFTWASGWKSPFYCDNDFIGEHKAEEWREILEKIVKDENLANVKYINGLSLLDSVKYLSADKVHPNIYGVQKIADGLTAFIRGELKK